MATLYEQSIPLRKLQGYGERSLTCEKAEQLQSQFSHSHHAYMYQTQPQGSVAYFTLKTTPEGRYHYLFYL